MIFNQYCALTIFFGTLCNIQFMTCSWLKWTSSTQKTKSKSKIFDDTEELKLSLTLDTGFSYEPISIIFERNLDELKRMIIRENKPESFKLFTKPQIMYYDLYCSNLYNLLQYTSILQSLIVRNDSYQTHEFDNVLLNESIIQHMLAVIIKLDLTEELRSFWNLYMFAIYMKNLWKDYDALLLHHFKKILHKIIHYLWLYTNKDCRIDNKYNLLDQFSEQEFALNERQKISMAVDVMEVMVYRNNINKILLHGEEVENWVSIKKIYLYEIIQNTDILKTIIKDFGEQSEESYNDIVNDIYVAYEAARNYYWFDEWISKIRVYHDKIFNIFRVVTLHFIRKHLLYLMNKDEKIVKKYNKQMSSFFSDNSFTFNYMLFSDITDFESIPKLFLNTPSNLNETYDNINSNIISNIENKIQTTFVVKSFEILPIGVDNEIYNEHSIINTEILRSYVQISKEKNENINKLRKFSKIKGLNDNFVRFNIFLEYFMKIFISKHNFNVFRTFMKFSSNYESRRPQEADNERYLDLENIY